MRTIGLTGGIGSGKSSVSRWLTKHGIPVLDADKIVHWLLAEDKKLIQELVAEFGEKVLTHEGCIDRKMLGSLIFGDERRRVFLEKAVHPRVLEILLQERRTLAEQGCKLCVWDIPLLFEAGMEGYVDEVWVVWTEESAQLLRVSERDKLPVEDIEKRILAQMPLADKRMRADRVIDNSGQWEGTEKQLERLTMEFILTQEG